MTDRFSPVQETHADSRKAVRVAALAVLGLCVAGALAIPTAASPRLVDRSIFYEQFAKIEAPGLAIVAAFACAVLLLLRSAPEERDADEPWYVDPRAIWVLALVVLAVSLAGTYAVF